jgi:hypothetical protein
VHLQLFFSVTVRVINFKYSLQFVANHTVHSYCVNFLAWCLNKNPYALVSAHLTIFIPSVLLGCN